MKVYIAGKITGKPNYKEAFEEAKVELEKRGHTVMNPAVLPPGFEHHEYMHICYAMIDVCDCVCFLEDWLRSKGALLENDYAITNKKLRMFQVEDGGAA